MTAIFVLIQYLFALLVILLGAGRVFVFKRMGLLTRFMLAALVVAWLSFVFSPKGNVLPLVALGAMFGAYTLQLGKPLSTQALTVVAPIILCLLLLGFVEVNTGAAILLMVLPYQKTKRDWALWIVTLLLTFSRSAWIGALLVIGLQNLPAIRRRVPVWMFPLIGGALGFFLVWLQPSTVYDRLLTWRDAFGAFVDNPLFGVGTGAYRHIVHSGFTIYHADSLPLTVLAEMGIAGLAAFGVLAFAIYANVQATSNPARWGVFAFGIMCLVDAPLYAPLVAMLFGLMLAQLEYVPVVEVPVKFPATTIHELAEVE